MLFWCLLPRLCEGHMEKLCRVSLLDKSMIDPKVEASYRQAAASAKAIQFQYVSIAVMLCLSVF